jgi:hypothetical protein
VLFRSSSRATFSYTNDASLLLPTRALTGHYTVSAHDNWSARDRFANPIATLGGFITIVGVDSSESGTQVTVRLRGAIGAGTGVAAADPGTQRYTLRLGDVLQLVGSRPDEDLTGTTIEASHPVAVFTGNDCTNMPDALPACDHLEEQLFPNETWGRRYAVTQLRDRGPTEHHRVRILSQRPGNQLAFDGIPTPRECASVLTGGEYCEFETIGSFQVTGTQPFLVTQFMVGQGGAAPMCEPADNPPNIPECMGDPAMVTEVPVDQYRHAYDFYVPESYVRNFANVVLPENTTVTLDGMPVSGTPDPVGTGMRVLFLPITAGRQIGRASCRERVS